jgi:hypothetical protein
MQGAGEDITALYEGNRRKLRSMWSSAAAMIDGRACKGIFAGGDQAPEPQEKTLPQAAARY